MPLPFLKNRQEGAASGPVDTIKREPDEPADYDMLDAVAEDMMEAFNRRDTTALKTALSALIEHLQSQDEKQDEQTMEGSI